MKRFAIHFRWFIKLPAHRHRVTAIDFLKIDMHRAACPALHHMGSESDEASRAKLAIAIYL